jgi:tetratricopeptide (TPR) repeat protein
VNRDLDEAAALLEEGKWPEARAPVEQAANLLAAAGRQDRPPRLEELRRDVAMAERLEEIYSPPPDEEPDTDREQDAAYAKAFQGYGIDLAVLPVTEAAERIRARTIRLELALALDCWTIRRRHTANREAPPWKHLLAVSRKADPDPWRDRLREALEGGDRKALVALAAEADVRRLPRETLALLARTLTILPKPKGKPAVLTRETALDGVSRQHVVVFLRNAQRQYPQDVWLNLALAEYHLYFNPKLDEAIRFYTRASALRPDSPAIAYGLGMALLRKSRSPVLGDKAKDSKEAIDEFSKAIALKPDFLNALAERGRLYVELGRPNEALADSTRAIELGSEWPKEWFGRGWAYTRLRQWERAIPDFSRALQMQPRYREAQTHRGYAYSVLGQWEKAAADLFPGGTVWKGGDDLAFQLACLRLLQGDTRIYHQQCREMITSTARIKIGFNESAFQASRACMLHPEGGTAPAQGVLWAEKAVAGDPKAGWYIHALALAHYRAGKFDQAVRSCGESQQADPHWGGAILNRLLLAMAHQRLGRDEEARQCMATAVRWRQGAVDGTYKGEEVTPPAMHLSDWLEFEVLYREAREDLNMP